MAHVAGTNERVAVAADAASNRDIYCRGCGYQLTSGESPARCPECGAPARLAVSPLLLEYCDPEVSRLIRIGLVLMSVAIFYEVFRSLPVIWFDAARRLYWSARLPIVAPRMLLEFAGFMVAARGLSRLVTKPRHILLPAALQCIAVVRLAIWGYFEFDIYLNANIGIEAFAAKVLVEMVAYSIFAVFMRRTATLLGDKALADRCLALIFVAPFFALVSNYLSETLASIPGTVGLLPVLDGLTKQFGLSLAPQPPPAVGSPQNTMLGLVSALYLTACYWWAGAFDRSTRACSAAKKKAIENWRVPEPTQD